MLTSRSWLVAQLKAMAVLERDARQAAGEPPLVSDDQANLAPPSTDAPFNDTLEPAPDGLSINPLDPAAAAASTADLSALFPFAPLEPNDTSQPLQLDGTTPAPAGIQLDLSFLDGSAPLDATGTVSADAPLDLSFLSDTSLFPTGGDATTATEPPPSLFPTSASAPPPDPAILPPPLPASDSAPSSAAPADPAAPAPGVTDLSSLLAMANSFPAAAAAATAGTDAIAPGFESGMDMFGGLDLSGADGTAPLDFDMAGLDFSSLGDLGDLGMGGDVGAIDFDALLRSMPPVEGGASN